MALCAGALALLALALVEGARSGCVRMEGQIVGQTALHSALGEYHRELWKQYHLLFLDAAYGGEKAAKEAVQGRIQWYLDKNLPRDGVFLQEIPWVYKDWLRLSVRAAPLRGISLASDWGGAVFRQRAARVMENRWGFTYPAYLEEAFSTVTDRALDRQDVAGQRRAALEALGRYRYTPREDAVEEDVPDGEGDKSGEGRKPAANKPKKKLDPLPIPNPCQWLEGRLGQGILALALPQPGEYSKNRAELENLIHARRGRQDLWQGNMPRPQRQAVAGGLGEKWLFMEYVVFYSGHYGHINEKNQLKYQMEYVLWGGGGDEENLRITASRLMALREAANLAHLYGEEKKRGLAREVSQAICALLQVPEAAPVLESVILLSWASWESVLDLKQLFSGGRVPLIKTEEQWRSDLDAVLGGGGEERHGEDSGLCYLDYLRIFFLLGGEEELTFRFMDIVEMDIRATPYNKDFCLDGCIDAFISPLVIESGFGYSYEMERTMEY